MMKPPRHAIFSQSMPAFGIGIILCLSFGELAAAQMSPTVQRGATFAQANCASCHSIDKITLSTLPLAPPFRDLHLRYPVESLATGLVEGIITNHPNMPEFRLDLGQTRDFLDFLKTLER
jgi:mono/diheme cytochrome c family protein